MSDNEDLDIVDDRPESGYYTLEINMESFISGIHSNLNDHPFYYSGNSDRTDQHRRSDINKAEKLTGKDLFDTWGTPNNDYAKEGSKVPVTVRH